MRRLSYHDDNVPVNCVVIQHALSITTIISLYWECRYCRGQMDVIMRCVESISYTSGPLASVAKGIHPLINDLCYKFVPWMARPHCVQIKLDNRLGHSAVFVCHLCTPISLGWRTKLKCWQNHSIWKLNTYKQSSPCANLVITLSTYHNADTWQSYVMGTFFALLVICTKVNGHRWITLVKDRYGQDDALEMSTRFV